MNIRPDDPLPAGFEKYTPDAFAAAQTSGATIIVDVYASWCPTCMAQHKVLDTLLQVPRYSEIKGFRVDYEGDRDFVRSHQVRVQSTIIMFRGEEEVSRSSGLTAAGPIHSQVDHALSVGGDSGF